MNETEQSGRQSDGIGAVASPGRGERQGMTRRTAIKTAAMAGAGVAAAPRVLFAGGQTATLRVGLVGCGGRGTGAAVNCVESSAGVEIVAMGDLFPDRLASCRERLGERLGTALTATDATCFAGFDAYRAVLDTDIDMVIFATPPAFRPIHLRAAIDAGKHVFMEKPVAVDPTGIRSVMESARLAAGKGLAIVAGTQRRHEAPYIEAMKRIHDGAIGEVVSAQVFWNQGGLWKRDRQPGWTDMEWQARNWLYFTWLSGDHIVEQHIHNLDVANWALQGHPVKAVGVGGRQVRVEPEYGHIFDHFAIELEYPSGARVLSMCRQIDGSANHVGEHLVGTAGAADPARWIRGARAWEWGDAEYTNPYVQEHTDLIASIRAGTPLNEGRQVAESTLTAIMGREAAYTGQEIVWEELLAADLSLVPERFAFGPMPMPPVAVPGVTTLARTL
jgi:predicted dehydrogenase